MFAASTFVLQAVPPAPGSPSEKTAVIQDSVLREVPATDQSAQTIAITVDWDQKQRQAPAGLYSVAGFQAGNPEVAANKLYQDNLNFLGIGTLRYHTAESLQDFSRNKNGWLDTAKRTWAAEPIVAAVSAWQPKDVRKIVNIIGWPEWMDANKDGYLDANQVEAFATFCAELVRILNVQAGLGISYFEITNEKDGLYWIDPAEKKQPTRTKEFAEIYNRAAAAMKAVDPTIKVGGPAAMRPDRSEALFEWVKLVLPNLDFLSVHMYASGNPKDPDIHIWDRTEVFGTAAADLRKTLDQLSPERRIELHVNEFNISWTWETKDVRMTNHIGAVFDALALVELTNGGADVINAWNECDGIYGKMDGAFKLRPAANVFHLFNRSLVGDVVKSKSTRPRQVRAFAVKQGNTRNLLLINRTDVPRKVNIAGSLPVEGTRTFSQISASGFAEDQKVAAEDSILLPQESVTLLSVSPST